MVKDDGGSGDEVNKRDETPKQTCRNQPPCLKSKPQNKTPENNQMELSLTNASTASCSSLALSAAAVSLNISPGW